MRLSFVHLRKRPRIPQNENLVPFKEILPIKLKDRVSGKGATKEKGGCFHEITLLFSCLGENNFENKYCLPQIQAFEKCHKQYMATSKQQKLAQLSRIPVPNSKNLTPSQITYMLHQYPNV